MYIYSPYLNYLANIHLPILVGQEIIIYTYIQVTYSMKLSFSNHTDRR